MEEKNVHSAYYYEPENADSAVLFIHGFMGSPNQFRTLSDAAVKNGFSVSSILLPGHGFSGREFARSKKTDWEKAVKDQITSLSRKYSKIVLAGHSMGALLSLRGSVEFRGVVKGVAAIAAPMYIRLKFSTIRTSYAVAFGKRRDDDERLKAAFELCSVKRSPLTTYMLGIPRYIDLFRMIHETKMLLDKIEVPVLIIHAEDDEVANIGGIKVLEKKLPRYEKLVLHGSGHYYISPNDSIRMTAAFIDFLDRSLKNDSSC